MLELAEQTREMKAVFGLRRVFDAERLNHLANHPDVRPTCGGDGVSRIDLTEFAADPNNYALVWPDGALMFVWTAPATYEVHIMVMPQGRGATAYRMVREAVAWLADEGAERIWARVDTPRLRHVAAQTGFKRCGPNLYQWKTSCLQH